MSEEDRESPNEARATEGEGGEGRADKQGDEAAKGRARPPSLGLALALTLLAPLAVLLGDRVVVPGFDPSGFKPELGAKPTGLFALGVIPFISAALIVEIVALVVPSWRPLRHGGPEGRRKLARAAMILGLALSAFQAFGIARLLAGASPTGDVSTPLVIASLVGGAALLASLAELSATRGLASGYAVIYSALSLYVSPESIAYWYAGSFTPSNLIGLLAAIAATIAITWYALESRRAEPTAPVKITEGYREPAKPVAPPAISLPIPTSGLAPFTLGASLLALWSTLQALLGAPVVAFQKRLEEPQQTLTSLASIFLASALLSLLFNHPARVGALFARARKKASAAQLAGEASARLRPAIARTITFLLALLAADTLARRITDLPPPTVAITLATALFLDIRAEWRARRATPDLVPVWPEHRPYAIAPAREALAAAGIHVFARGERLRALLQFAGPYAPIDLLVREDDAKRAAKILKRVLLAKKDEAPVRAEEASPALIGARLIAPIALLAVGLALFSFMAQRPPPLPPRPTATLELVAVDDDRDLFPSDVARADGAPAGVSLIPENVPLGPEKSRLTRYARISTQDHETRDQARARFLPWLMGLTLPAGDRVAVGELFELDPDKDTMEPVGWRAYLLTGQPVITAADVENAQVMPDSAEPRGWLVHLKLNPAGARRFEDHTAANVKRRVAILVDGIVMSAPVITTRIPGGVAVITMGSGPPDQQKADATRLVRSLMGR